MCAGQKLPCKSYFYLLIEKEAEFSTEPNTTRFRLSCDPLFLNWTSIGVRSRTPIVTRPTITWVARSLRAGALHPCYPPIMRCNTAIINGVTPLLSILNHLAVSGWWHWREGANAPPLVPPP
jgi:hypothetical protein